LGRKTGDAADAAKPDKTGAGPAPAAEVKPSQAAAPEAGEREQEKSAVEETNLFEEHLSK
jgi:hypothetical protein